ncbi:MAG: PD-(D/E)XK nuclease family protein, partial [Myxococcota bacterium]
WAERIGLSEVGPSVSELAELKLEQETRFSLLLAALLDPARTPATAHAFWGALIGVLRKLGGRHAAVVEDWEPALVDHLAVWPKRHGAEWNNIDVFGRVMIEGVYRLGIVIEVKTNPLTGEQPEQLQRYHGLIKGRWNALARTIFIYLTDNGRLPTTAGKSVDDWAVIGWKTIAELALDVAEMDGTEAQARSLMLQVHDTIQTEILAAEALADLYAPHRDLAELSDDAGLCRNHSRIIQLWLHANGRRPQ